MRAFHVVVCGLVAVMVLGGTLGLSDETLAVGYFSREEMKTMDQEKQQV